MLDSVPTRSLTRRTVASICAPRASTIGLAVIGDVLCNDDEAATYAVMARLEDRAFNKEVTLKLEKSISKHISANVRNMQVMVVDDDEFSRSMLVRILRKLRIERIREASNGVAALNDLRSLGRVDCMFLDFDMPLMNGLELLKSIRDGSANVSRKTSIVMLTAHNNLGLTRTAIALDVSAFLSKPASADVITNRLLRIRTGDLELKPAESYAEVVLPSFKLSGRSDLAPVHLAEEDGAGVLMRLEEIPINARIARGVIGPDGSELLPKGTVLSAKLLIYLHDLLDLDSCVANLWVELGDAALHQG